MKKKRQEYRVIHPLYDKPEQKLSADGLEPIHLSLGGKISLMALRGYLVVMVLLVFYHVLNLAGVL